MSNERDSEAKTEFQITTSIVLLVFCSVLIVINIFYSFISTIIALSVDTFTKIFSFNFNSRLAVRVDLIKFFILAFICTLVIKFFKSR